MSNKYESLTVASDVPCPNEELDDDRSSDELTLNNGPDNQISTKLIPAVPESQTERRTLSPIRRIVMLIIFALAVWLAFSMRKQLLSPKSSKVIHANRYSKDFKFRPAASPVITESLKDGRIRLRGAHAEAVPTVTPEVKKQKGKTKSGEKRARKGGRRK